MTVDPAWFDFVKVGDVLQRGDGPYRVVRDVTRWTRGPKREITRGVGPLRCVTFAIRRPSWTGRCYTVVTAADLKVFSYRYVGARIALTSELDAKIDAAINQPGTERPYILTARDVQGIA